MKKKLVSICVICAALTGCVTGPVATTGWIGGVTEYGAVAGYGNTMRANPKCTSVQMLEKTSSSLFNARAKDTQRQFLVVMPSTSNDVNNTSAAIAMVNAMAYSTNTLQGEVAGYQAVWTPATKGVSLPSLKSVKSVATNFVGLAGSGAVTTNYVYTLEDGSVCTNCAVAR